VIYKHEARASEWRNRGEAAVALSYGSLFCRLTPAAICDGPLRGELVRNHYSVASPASGSVNFATGSPHSASNDSLHDSHVTSVPSVRASERRNRGEAAVALSYGSKPNATYFVSRRR